MTDKPASFAYAVVKRTMLFPLVIISVIGHSLDVATTWYALTHTGAREGNPFMAPLLHSEWRWKWVAISALKSWAIKRNVEFSYEWNDLRTMAFDCVVIWSVVAWNISVIWRRKHAVRTVRT